MSYTDLYILYCNTSDTPSSKKNKKLQVQLLTLTSQWLWKCSSLEIIKVINEQRTEISEHRLSLWNLRYSCILPISMPFSHSYMRNKGNLVYYNQVTPDPVITLGPWFEQILKRSDSQCWISNKVSNHYASCFLTGIFFNLHL